MKLNKSENFVKVSSLPRYSEYYLQKVANSMLKRGWKITPFKLYLDREGKKKVLPYCLNKKTYQITPQDAWPAGYNGALGTHSDYVVVDIDNISAVKHFMSWLPPCKLIVRTKRGMHLYYKNGGFTTHKNYAGLLDLIYCKPGNKAPGIIIPGSQFHDKTGFYTSYSNKELKDLTILTSEILETAIDKSPIQPKAPPQPVKKKTLNPSYPLSKKTGRRIIYSYTAGNRWSQGTYDLFMDHLKNDGENIPEIKSALMAAGVGEGEVTRWNRRALEKALKI